MEARDYNADLIEK